ncbi:DUF547 domain-containing protein [Polaribacter sp. AHE13PA]|uniref:DUF547 domain-containing protein n=1 Tax=Polaribacter sp. AHE13PA TaxID=2745562 RepID=UPI001C4F3C1D|nr:DUF547 domain-containing protein [Polaribacter sp. AHE13PA]QXP65486.1 DUF547 domain-containing protein [Polaribacter sp. AHE13PA]
MKKILIVIVTLFALSNTNAQTAIFHNLLQNNVTKDGVVDYKSLKQNPSELNSYISYLEKTTPDNSWSKNKQKAFWINAYNAYTLKLILDNYPLKSITNIKENGLIAWKIPFAKVGGKTYTLDHIEHTILRKKFSDPKIHVGVNCASGSCPKLGNKAFTEKNIEAELTHLMKVFVNDTSRNKITENNIQISSIFDWFKEDFIKKGTIIDFLNKYSETKISPKAKISYLKYDWSLNGK